MGGKNSCFRISLVSGLLGISLGASALGPADIHSEIQQSLQVHSQAQDFHDWADSAHTPEKLFTKWMREPNLQQLAAVVCSQLAQLSDTELSLFQDAIETHPFAAHLRCKDSVLEKVLIFFDSARNSIVDRLPAIPQTIGRDGQPAQPPTLGPSLEMDIKTDAGPVYFNADLDKKYIAFTFDDGPHSRNTQELLSVLAQEQVQATFFMVGKNVRALPQIVKEVARDGHSVGNHTWSHKNLHKTGFDGGTQEIMDGFQAIWDVLGYSHPFFRFPFGNRTDDLQKFVKANQFGTFFWNIDTLDWKYKDPDFLYDYALKQIENQGRGIVLFHDIQPQTIVVMPMLLHTLKAKGYMPVVFRSPEIRPQLPRP